MPRNKNVAAPSARRLVTERDIEARYSIPVQSLRNARSRGVGALATLPFYKIGARVLYDATEVERWVDRHRVEVAP